MGIRDFGSPKMEEPQPTITPPADQSPPEQVEALKEAPPAEEEKPAPTHAPEEQPAGGWWDRLVQRVRRLFGS